MKNFLINCAFVATKNFGQINRALAAKKKLNFLKLLVLAGVLMMSIPQAWATKTAIPANTVIYVDITNFHDDSHTENNATDNKYYISQPNYYNVTNNRSTSASSTTGAGEYWPGGDSTWLELSVVSGNIYCAKTTTKWYDGNISFWTKKEDNYGNVWQSCVALMQEYDGANNLYTISSGSQYHNSRNATCFGTDVSVMPTFTAGRTLYLNAGTYWDVDKAIFRAYFFNGVTSKWETCYQVGSTHYYSVTVPDGSWTHVIFVRKDPSTNVENSWTGKWNQTSDMAPSGMNNCVNITASGNNNQSWGDYAPTPAIAGSMNNWAPDTHVMSDGSVGIELDGGKAYAFQIVSGTTWYGSPDSQYKITCVGQDQTFNPTPSANHILLLTAGDGIYTFHWDGTDLTIDYPTVTHPSADYVYFKDNEGWHESYFTTHLWGGTTGTTWETLPVLTAFNFDGTDYYYTALGGNTTGLVSKGSTSNNDEKTADLSLSSHKGQWYNVVDKTTQSSEVAANWKDFTATLTLKTNQGETTNPSPTTVTVTYGKATNINVDVITTTSPAKTGYTFGGYYTSAGGGGTQIINASEKIPTDVSGYTTSGKWTKTGESVSADLFAKWTQNITLNQNSATTEGTTSLAATYNAVLNASGITNPEKDYYDFGGWTNGTGGSGDVVINASKVVQTVASWTDGDKKWTHAGASTLYAKWTEHPYTVTATAGEGGSVGSASYTGKVVTTTAISATPNTGYKFSHWSVESGNVTFGDQYSASTTINATSDAEIKANFVYRWSIAGTWKYYPDTDTEDADAYAMGNIGTNGSSKDTCYVEITLAANTNYTFQVVDRSTSPYTWYKNSSEEGAPFYMTYGNSTAWSFATDKTKACGITTAGAGTYKFAFNITDKKVTVTYPNSYTVTFGYGTGGSAVTATVEDAGSISSGDYATAGKDITFTKTAANLAYTFKGWYNASSDGDAISCMASDDVYDDIAANISVYAQFKTRYGLHGSLMDDNAGGMPGWAGDGADFIVVSFTALGEGTGKGVDLECSRTLEPNKEYKFRVQDRAAGSRWGLSSSAVLPAEAPGNNVKLNVYGDESGKDVKIETVGYGTYTFKITNMYDNSDGKYYPAIQVNRPASGQLTLGWKHYTNGELSDGNTGGTVTAETNEGSGFAITNGQFFASGSDITFTASPATGYHVEGWYSDASFETAYESGSGGATISGDGDVTLELSDVSTNKTVYVKFAEDTKEASGSGGWASKVGASSLTDVVTIDGTITVDVAHALAKRVVLDQSADGKAGKLVITANKGLEVAEGIWINNGSSLVAPTASDLTLASGAAGNAALIFDNSNSAAATVQMYSKASTAGADWAWQYIAAPAAVSALYNYYGGYLYKWTGSWTAVTGSDNMELFAGYCSTYPTAGHTYEIEGTLAATTSKDIAVAAGKSWVCGNSWTGPIQIAQMDEDDFEDMGEAAVYLFNTGMDSTGTGSTGTTAGTYITVTPATAGIAGKPSVISSLQGFYVKNTSGSAGTFKLNYTKHVRTDGSTSIANGAMYAPKRLTEVVPDKMKIVVEGSRYNSDVLLFAREGFSMGYDTCWDGRNINDPGVGPLLYTLREDGTKDAISAIPTYEGAVIGFEAGEDDEYTFRFTYDGEDNWYLNDTKMNQSTLITSENVYRFDVSSDDKTRFVISATPCNAPAVTTGVGETNEGAAARKLMIDGMLYIVRSGRIYNAEGALVK